ncbi:hypothetical protein VMCG_07761 [Cytospora schulzeri]|uniref:M-phase inducer phosphatase n=1 Tax=Cytospora schulzeri TaxID=448051 RepID=A0A423VZM8_9PEZI|nr:hypothetical protein VMCG_07761 [Valsa malicola]
MEASSPLAAMHPPAAPSFGHPDIFRSNDRATFKGQRRSTGALFRERLMPKGKDYFNVKSVRGTSPTGSLAADLSQNFCIDNEARQSPVPNASSGSFHNECYNGCSRAKSPHVVDVHSPTPMASPHVVDVHSPTPMASPHVVVDDDDDDEDMTLLESPAPISRHSSIDIMRPLAENRRKLNLRRPDLTRSKGYSTGAMPTRSHPENQKQYRRSQSMFESTGDVIKPKEDLHAPPVTLQSVKDIEEPAELVLPHFFPEAQNDSIPRVSRSTFLEILDGKYNKHYTNKLIIDCRFEYEYEGGHVDGAINYNNKELLSSHLFQSPLEGRTLLLFHCEYSVHRAPLMARHIRSQDRTVNAECYPKLTYPEVYILEGGYSGFFEEHRLRCYPQSYVGMNAAEHANTCEKEMDRLRQPRKGLGRARTYAFGEREHPFPHSPTASLLDSCDDSPLQLGDSPSMGYDRNNSKRMASY